MKRESFRSRLGFLLVSAGCAIGIGNVWRFPYVVGELDSVIYLSDLYNNMLLQGLCYNLCIYYKLADYKDAFETEFEKAKAAIKRSNVTARMLQRNSARFGDYRDIYAAALSPDATF